MGPGIIPRVEKRRELPVNTPKQQSLDEIVSQRAVVIAEQIQNAAAWAKSEMDLQVEVAGALKGFAREAKINPLEGHHNVTIATGRPDSVYGSVIVEYKEPGTLSPNKDAAPNKAVIEQLKRRFSDMNREEHRNWSSMFGVGTDGKYFIFLRFRRDKWSDEDPLPVNRYSTERFLWALYNLGQKGKPYLPDYLHGDFGSDSPVAQEGVRALYEEILATENPKAQVFFNQWKILFGEVCGYDVENLSDKLKKLAEFYVVKGKPQPAPLLFAVHTYYAILIKLLAAEIVSFFNPWMPRQVEKLQSATTPAKLKRELEDLERGGIFHQMGITNFLEGDLFSWYLAVWSPPIEALVRKMVTKLDEYNPGTFSEEPAQSRDLLKKLYQQLFPKSVRHDLGEYYTPDWLAEHVLNELGYVGDPDKRLLDPACGSGTFLVMAINRIRRWYDQNREKCAYDEGELLKKILANVIGFDLNPLAVMAARTNYLVAIKDLIRHVDHVEIPVYLCDSIMTPAEYGDLFSGATLGKVAKVPCSAMKPPHLLVPKEIAQSPKEVAKYADVLEQCVKNAYAPEEFLSRCRDEGLNITATDAHLDLYKELVKLDKANKNGIWARIIKNNFAPLFVGRVDYVAGNPPWITFENLPSEYRPDLIRVFDDHYNLFVAQGLAARHGSSAIDISALFPYVSVERYLSRFGKLGLVITQTLFQSIAASGFRKFRLPDGTGLGVTKIHDMVSLQPFDDATNKTAVLILVSASNTQYPVPCTTWRWKLNRPDNVLDLSLQEVKTMTVRTSNQSAPISVEAPTSPWLICSSKINSALRKVTGTFFYRPHKGCDTSGANAIYWVEVLNELPGSKLLVRNLGDAGRQHKFKSIERQVEGELVLPLLRGRDTARWFASPSCHILCAQSYSDFSHALSEAELKKRAPLLHSYFNIDVFRKRLQERAGYKKYLKPQGEPFWALYDIKNYTVAPHKIVIREQASQLTAAVTGSVDGKVVIPDHKLSLIATDSDDEAHYLCALLNSAPAKLLILEFGISTQISVSTIGRIRVAKFDENNGKHCSLARLSKLCSAVVAKGEGHKLAHIEGQVDATAAKLWGITDDELKVIQEALAETGKSRRKAKEEDEDL